MPTHPRKHSDATQITTEILKKAAAPRQSASVKKALEKKKTPAPVAPHTLIGKTKAAERSADSVAQ